MVCPCAASVAARPRPHPPRTRTDERLYQASLKEKSGNPWGLPLFKFYLTRVTGVGE